MTRDSDGVTTGTAMHISEDDLVLHYYGELDAAGDARTASHLEECRTCHAAFARLQRVLAVVDAAPAMELPDGFERTVWARLEPSLARQRSHWFKWFVLSPARLAWAAGILLLVGGAFFAGQVSERQAQPVRTAAGGPDLRERILLSDLSEHLDRSQMVLIDLVSGDAEGTVDMSYERERAGELVAANRLYRQTAAATGDAAIGELLEDLERLLVDLAASPDELSAEDLQGMRQRIEAKELLFKVRVLSSSVREKQQQQVRTRTGQSS